MSTLDPIPLVDLRAQHLQIEDEVREGFENVLSSCGFIQGTPVAEFEAAFAAFSGVEHCIGVGNGTDAIELALRAVGVSPGDEVLLPANTFVATAEAVVRAGATPVLTDCDEHFLIDPSSAAARVSPRTRAILPVHLYGQLAEMQRILPLADDANLAVVEDAAQAQGASRDGRGAGAWGDAAGTSFYPGKNLGAYGDAGAVLTSSDFLAARVRRLSNHGGQARYDHRDIGMNSRLDTLQAIVLQAKLAKLAGWNEARRRAAERYTDLLRDLDEVATPATLPGNLHVWHLYVVRVPHRDEVLRTLQTAGIGAGIHYPAPVHLTPAFAYLGHRPGDFPVAEAASAEILSLPMHPHLTASHQERVVDELRRALRRPRSTGAGPA